MQTITDDNVFHRLIFDNPWWGFTKETKIRFRNPRRRVFFQAFYDRVMAAEDGHVTVLAGSLRAGKTVMMRQMVAHLIETGTAPNRVFYGNMATPSLAAAHIPTLFHMFRRHHGHHRDTELYVFLDEAQYIQDWRDVVLSLADAWPRVRIVAAVSSGAPALNTGDTTDNGRLGVFVLPPLTFLEFLRFRGTEDKLFDVERHDAGVNMTMKASALPVLNTEFHRYINFGGFLEGIVLSKAEAPAPTFIRDSVAERVLHKDLAALHGVNDTRELNRLFSLLTFNTAREVTFDGLARATGIARNTLRKYLDYLESAFLIRRVWRVDQYGNRFQRQVAFKVYVSTPCLYAALFAPVPDDDERFARLAETALVGQWLGTPAAAHLVYARWRGGRVDLLTLNPDTGRPDHIYEIDWGNACANADAGPHHMVRFVQNTNRRARPYILTQSTARPARMDNIDMTLLPLALYAYWLERAPALRNFSPPTRAVQTPKKDAVAAAIAFPNAFG